LILDWRDRKVCAGDVGRLKRLGGGAEEVIEVAEGICIGVSGGVVAFEMLDDAVDAASE